MSRNEHLTLPVGAKTPLAELLEKRRSTRDFTEAEIRMTELAHLLRAAVGLRTDGGSVLPSAHRLNLLSVGVVAGGVENLRPGSYVYLPETDALICDTLGDHRNEVASATLGDHSWSVRASAFLLITAQIEALKNHFAEQSPLGRRGERYAWLEAGHVSQNTYLAAAELGLGAVLIAGFRDEELSSLSETLFPSLPSDSRVLGIVALGQGVQSPGS